MSAAHDDFATYAAQEAAAVAGVLNGMVPKMVAALVAGGIAMESADPVGQFDRLTGFGYRLDLVEGRYKL